MSVLFIKLAYAISSIINKLPTKIVVKLQSVSRRYFMHRFYNEKPVHISFNNLNCQKILWGITFRLPLINSAGMFKNGQSYDFVSSIGAGGYLGGTSTYDYRYGNIKYGIKHPFLNLVKSHISINYLGLPNKGDELLSKVKITEKKIIGCPIGWSISYSPNLSHHIALEKIISSLWLYHDNLDIDFIEINESCPNTDVENEQSSINIQNLRSRLALIKRSFLDSRRRHLPVVVKFSNDLVINHLPQVLDILFEYNFDGITLGNTSTNYSMVRQKISSATEQKLFDYFTTTFGGGVSGIVLKNISLTLCEEAANYRDKQNLKKEFHIIRSGGVSTMEDIIASNNSGISLNQWYSGFFENYARFGKKTYAHMFISSQY